MKKLYAALDDLVPRYFGEEGIAWLERASLTEIVSIQEKHLLGDWMICVHLN